MFREERRIHGFRYYDEETELVTGPECPDREGAPRREGP